MKFYLQGEKVTARAESLKDIEVLIRLKNGERVSLNEGLSSNIITVAPDKAPSKIVEKKGGKRYNKTWDKEEDDKIVELWNKGYPPEKIAIKVHRTVSAITSRLGRLRNWGWYYVRDKRSIVEQKNKTSFSKTNDEEDLGDNKKNGIENNKKNRGILDWD